jgi:hypothetical protein
MLDSNRRGGLSCRHQPPDDADGVVCGTCAGCQEVTRNMPLIFGNHASFGARIGGRALLVRAFNVQ